MGDLKVEVRVNKNGHAVRKYVRADSGTALAMTSIPAPGMDVPSESTRLREVCVTGVLEAANVEEHETTNVDLPKNLTQYLKDTFSDETLAAFHAEGNGDAFNPYWEIMLGVLSNRDDDQTAQYLLMISKLDRQKSWAWIEAEQGPETYATSKELLRGLVSHYGSIDYRPPSNILDSDDPEVVKVVGLINLTHRIWETSDGETSDTMYFSSPVDYAPASYVRLNDQLARLALDRPQDVQRIADILEEGEVTNADLIVARLDSEVPSLQRGML